MSKFLKGLIVICLLSLVFLTGCDDSNGGEDTHYKPSEYKHNIAIDKANSDIDDINKEIIQMGAETSADIVINTYNDSLKKLNEHLTTLENTKNQLSEDTDLTNSEVKSWNSRYKESISYVESTIEKIEKERTDFLK